MSNYPTDLDFFPFIEPEDDFDTEGKEHDLLHNKTHEAIQSLQQEVGVTGSNDTDSLRFKADMFDAMVKRVLPDGAVLKGRVDEYDNLPDEDLSEGDAYFCEEDGLVYVWDGEGFPDDGGGNLLSLVGDNIVALPVINKGDSNTTDTTGWTNRVGTLTTRVQYGVGVFMSRDSRTEAYQNIPIPQNIGKITLSWRQSSYEQKDGTSHGVEFLDSSGNVIMGAFAAFYTGIRSTEISSWRMADYREVSSYVPIGAVTARIVLVGIRYAGTDSNWYTHHIRLIGEIAPRLSEE